MLALGQLSRSALSRSLLSPSLRSRSLNFNFSRSLATMTASTTKPNALLFGFGAIGGVYAHLLQESGGVNVSAVARSNYAALKENGYKLVSAKFGEHSHKLDGGE
jgi:lactate dehydrogenase-like 2-hydroxyacid dehydrogenase